MINPLSNLPTDHSIIAAGLTVGTASYMGRWIIIDLITALFEIVNSFRFQKEKLKLPPK